jgi:fibrillarin-like pre-rRNA processing protein
MRPGPAFEAHRASPRLWTRRFGERRELWTETVGRLPPVYGERWRDEARRRLRAFDPARSKLAAGIAAGWRGPLPMPGERWLYLGAASGSTASHVADLVGPEGAVYAIERSVRPFARLLATAERWPNLLPILADAREPERYADLVPPVTGLYADIAQPDQVEILLRNGELLLAADGAPVLLALKTASMGRERTAVEHLEAALSQLSARIGLDRPVGLAPSHRAHYLVGGRWRSAASRPRVARGWERRASRSPARRPR